MKVSQLFFYIALAIIGFWLLGVAFKLAAWVLDIGLIVALVVVLLAIVNEFWQSRKTAKAPAKKASVKRTAKITKKK